jgi:menaquinone-dependent protoporphyrinogen oxidase
MGNKILVAYATKYGATAEIAEKIGQVLRNAGLNVDVELVHHISDLSPYDAVVLGSAVYIGGWRREAAGFLKSNEKILAKMPVWIFSSGPTGEGDPSAILQGWSLPKAIQPFIDRIKPRDIVLFHGAIYEDRIGFVEKWMVKNVKAPFGDFRDWTAITSWAAAIADSLKKGKVCG